MKALQPIGTEVQIENVLFSTPQSETDRVKEKVKILTDNITSIEKVNGSKVYDVFICSDFDNIYYNLEPTPEVFKNLLQVTEEKKVQHTRKYYYPIQYAKIEFSN
jgi:aspartate-semialdehyde dehydrogenase